MSKVIDLDDRRGPAPTSTALICACGGGWFELRSTGGRPGAVCMTTDGSLTGWHGAPHCIECGAPAFPPPLTP